jgi:hypothetical protein
VGQGFDAGIVVAHEAAKRGADLLVALGLHTGPTDVGFDALVAVVTDAQHPKQHDADEQL